MKVKASIQIKMTQHLLVQQRNSLFETVGYGHQDLIGGLMVAGTNFTQQESEPAQIDFLFLVFQVVFVLLNILSMIGSVIVFVVFFLESGSVFNSSNQQINSEDLSQRHTGNNLALPSEENVDDDSVRLNANQSFTFTIRNGEGGSTTHYMRSRANSSAKSGIINTKKKQFIRRTMLMLCISDLLFSLSNILFTIWKWCALYIPALSEVDGEYATVSWILSHLFAHGNFSFALCSATWSVSIAIAIYTTTKQVKWMENNYVYDILFHVSSWGIAILSFTTVFTFRLASKLTGFVDNDFQAENIVMTGFNFFAAFYLILVSLSA